MTQLTMKVGRRRAAPPSLRPARLDPLHVDVLAALIATIPAADTAKVIAFPGAQNEH